MSRSLSRRQAVLLGAVVLLGVGLAAFGLLAVSGVLSGYGLVGGRLWFGKDVWHVRVGFPEVRGVEVGTRVRVQGIDAGEVVAIAPPEQAGGPVVLRLRLKGEYRHLVRAGSTVQIVSEGMIGGKVLEVRPPRARPGQPPPDHGPAADDALLASEPTAELGDVLAQVSDTLGGVGSGQGALGSELVGALRSIKEAGDAAKETLSTSKDALEKGKDTLDSIQRDADAVGELPLVGRYVKDPHKILLRGNAERNRQCFAEDELFEPGRAVLTAAGRGKLDGLAPWLNGLKHKGSEVVVVAYADPKKADARAARALTRQQSEAVAEYLKTQHGAHKMSWLSSRKVTPLGMGTQPPPERERDPLPPARVEVLVFVPQG